MRRSRSMFQVVVAPSLWVVAITAFSFAFVSMAVADGFRVPDDYASIQAAVDAASDGDTVFVAEGEYTESTYISKNVTVVGEEASSTIVNARQEGYNVFTVADTSSAVLSGMTLQNGAVGVSVYFSSHVSLFDLIITDIQRFGVKIQEECSAQLRRVQILDHGETGIETESPVLVEDVLIAEGQEGLVVKSGGSVDSRAPGLTISRERIAGVRLSPAARTEYELGNLALTNNFGPAVLAEAYTELTLRDSKIIDNFGSGIMIETEEDMTLTGCDISGNGRYDVEVLSGEFGRILDFQHNNWGETTTAEMNQVGFPGNISTLWDQQDDPLLCMVDFSNWENPTGINGESPVPMSGQLALYQNAPNPFNPSTTIRFELPATTHATLNLYDLSGQRVQTLLDGELGKGEHSVSVELPQLASGVYLYRLETPQRVESRRMSLLK